MRCLPTGNPVGVTSSKVGATGECLPNSNQTRRHPISELSEAQSAPHSDAEPIDRRAIPAAAKESTWVAADGHVVRRIDWPGISHGPNPRGSILFLPGRADSYEKYLESLEEWHRAGWRVTASDWRGQAGSGRLGNDEVTGHIDDFSTWTGDLAYFWNQWVGEVPGPHVIIGHSMGGHLILRSLVEGSITPDAAVLCAPMLRMLGPRLPMFLLHGLAKFMTKIGDPARQAWKWNDKPGELPVGRLNLLTHDPDRYSDEAYWRQKRPELVMGPGSWRWVERGYASSKMLEKPGALEAVQVPVMIASTSFDPLVSHKANVIAANRLPNGVLITFGAEARHEILREVDQVRDRLMNEITRFLDEVAPANQPPQQ